MSSSSNSPDGPPKQGSADPADYSHTYKFLNFIFTGTANGFVEFRHFTAGRKGKSAGSSTYLALPLQHERVIGDVLRRNGQQTITFGPTPRCRVPRRGVGKDHDVLQAGCVWATLESRRIKGGVIEAMKRVRDLPLRPSVLAGDGFNHHVIFVLSSPLCDHHLLEWDELTHDLSQVLGRVSTGGLSRTIVLPGTLNLDEASPAWCEIAEEFSSWTRYGVGELREAIKSAPAHGNPSGAAFSVEHLRRRGLSAELIESVITGRATGQEGVFGSDLGGESGRDFRIVFALLEHGLEEEEVKAVFRSYPHGCGSKWAQKRDGEWYLESLLGKVIGYRQELADAGPHEGASAGLGLNATGLPPGYSRREDGSLWFHPPVADDARKVPKPVKVCNSPLRIAEIRENVDTGHISLVVTFSYLGRTVSAPILRSQMSDPRRLAATLSDVGAPVTSLNARHVTAYLTAFEHHFAGSIRRKRVTSRFGRGRAGGPFFFPGLSAGVEFEPAGAGDAALYRAYISRRGTLHGWLEAVRAVAAENLLIPQVAVLAALVPPLQRKLQIPNFILDLHGNTSTGKSTSLRLAASVYGSPRDPDSLLLQWMNTSTAVEQVAAVCGELPVFLDDAQHCPAELKRTVVYMIANGRGKGRGGGQSGVRETPTWHTVALSSSEEPLQEASPHEGARGRILSVGGLVPPFKPGTASLVQAVERAVSDNHGHAGVAYIRHLNGWTEQEWSRWQRRHAEIRDELQRASSSNLAGRVSGYIAAVQLAGEVACPALGLPFQPDVVGAWLMLHLDEQQGEQNMILVALRALADYYIANRERFAIDSTINLTRRTSIEGLSRRGLYVAFLRRTVEDLFKLKKWNVTAVLNKLSTAGSLHATEKDRHTKKVSIGGVYHRMICVKWSAIFPDDNH